MFHPFFTILLEWSWVENEFLFEWCITAWISSRTLTCSFGTWISGLGAWIRESNLGNEHRTSSIKVLILVSKYANIYTLLINAGVEKSKQKPNLFIKQVAWPDLLNYFIEHRTSRLRTQNLNLRRQHLDLSGTWILNPKID